MVAGVSEKRAEPQYPISPALEVTVSGPEDCAPRCRGKTRPLLMAGFTLFGTFTDARPELLPSRSGGGEGDAM